MVKVKCANCGTERDLPVDNIPPKFVCTNKLCGALNSTVVTGEGADQACDCMLPTTPEYKMPAGRFWYPGVGWKYASPDDGTQLTEAEWADVFGYSPAIVYDEMKKLGREGMAGFKNLSTLGREK